MDDSQNLIRNWRKTLVEKKSTLFQQEKSLEDLWEEEKFFHTLGLHENRLQVLTMLERKYSQQKLSKYELSWDEEKYSKYFEALSELALCHFYLGEDE